MRTLRASLGAVLLTGVSVSAVLAQPAPTSQQMVELLGKPPAGWQVVQGPAVYNEDNLWEWIDGEVPEVLTYLFDFAVSALLSSGDVQVEVGAFVMKTPLDAFGYFSHRSSPENKPAPLGNAAFWDGTQLHVWRNYAYLRFMPSTQDPKVKTRVRELADALLEHLPAAEKIPTLLTILPTNNRVPMTLAFTRSNVLGQGKLTNGVSADYRMGNKMMTAWVLDCGDKDSAKQVLALLAQVLGKQRAIAALGDEAFAGFTEDYGPTIALREEGYAAFVVHAVPPDFAEALLRMLTVRIRIAEAERKL